MECILPFLLSKEVVRSWEGPLWEVPLLYTSLCVFPEGEDSSNSFEKLRG